MPKFVAFVVALIVGTNLVVGCASTPTSPTPDPGPAPVVVNPSQGAQLIVQFVCCSIHPPGLGGTGRSINPFSNGRIEVVITTDQPMAIQLRLDNKEVVEKISTEGKTLVSFELDSIVNSIYFQNRGTGTATWQAEVYWVR